MFYSSVLLALVMLTAPCNDLSKFKYQGNLEVRNALRQISVNKQILDERETRYFLINEHSFVDDLQLLRNRYQNVKNAPCVEDVYCFPPRYIILESLQFNRFYRIYLEQLMTCLPEYKREQCRQAITETDYLYSIYDDLRDAQCDYYYVYLRRLSLQNLRDKLGSELYYSGQLPPSVPIWRFDIIR